MLLKHFSIDIAKYQINKIHCDHALRPRRKHMQFSVYYFNSGFDEAVPGFWKVKLEMPNKTANYFCVICNFDSNISVFVA